jgi:hypothetical protein
MNAATSRPGSSFTVTMEGSTKVETTTTVRGKTTTVKKVKYCPMGIIRRSEVSFGG